MHPHRKGISKTLVADNVISYVENPKESKLLELINELSKVSGCKVNIEKSTVYLLVTNN